MEMQTYRETLVQQHRERQGRFYNPRPRARLKEEEVAEIEIGNDVICPLAMTIQKHWSDGDLFAQRFAEAVRPAVAKARLALMKEGPSEIKVADIINAVAKAHELTPALLKGPARSTHIIKARFEAIYKIRGLTGHSMSFIGREFGGRDHTSIRNAILKHAKRNNLPRLGVMVGVAHNKGPHQRRMFEAATIPEASGKAPSDGV